MTFIFTSLAPVEDGPLLNILLITTSQDFKRIHFQVHPIKMASLHITRRAFRASMINISRPFSSTIFRSANANPGNAEEHDGTEEYRKYQKERPLNPHMTNTNSTIMNDMPSAGAGKVPPEFLTSVNGKFSPKDSVPENTERMTGGTQDGEGSGVNREMAVGELEGAQFRVAPLRRDGEHEEKMRARLLCMFFDIRYAYSLQFNYS